MEGDVKGGDKVDKGGKGGAGKVFGNPVREGGKKTAKRRRGKDSVEKLFWARTIGRNGRGQETRGQVKKPERRTV